MINKVSKFCVLTICIFLIFGCSENRFKKNDDLNVFSFGFTGHDASGEYYTYQATQNYINNNGKYLFKDSDKILLAPHEREHTYQSEILGPLFLPTYFLSGGVSSKNWLENKADKAGNKAYINWKYNENN